MASKEMVNAYIKIIYDWLDEYEFEAVRYGANVHDFCDANEAALQAFKKASGRDAEISVGDDGTPSTDCIVIHKIIAQAGRQSYILNFSLK